MKTTESTANSSGRQDYLRRINRAALAVDEADAVLIGAGSGLSAAAGLDYGGKAFREYFSDFIARFGISDLYSSSFYPYPSEEVRWAYWAKHVNMIRFAPPAMPLYLELLEAVRGKEYFVISTNVDGQFRKAGFDPARIFEVQGDYGLMQCRTACHKKLYDDDPAIHAMLPRIHECSIPSELVPRCPVCGGPMDIHVRTDANFIQDEDWHAMADNYENFISRYGGKRLVLLELGVGFNTPGIIRYPFEELTARNPSATLVRVNRDWPGSAPVNLERSIPFSEDCSRVIADLRRRQQTEY